MDERRTRNEEGQFKSEVSKDEILGMLEDSDDPVLTAKEISNELGVTSVTVNKYLKELQEEGLTERKQVGARAVVWWKL
jgi:Fic family protein